MNARRKLALVLTAGGFVFASLCLYKTTPLTMLGFFNLGLPLFAGGIAVYAYDLAVIILQLRRGEKP